MVFYICPCCHHDRLRSDMVNKGDGWLCKVCIIQGKFYLSGPLQTRDEYMATRKQEPLSKNCACCSRILPMQLFIDEESGRVFKYCKSCRLRQMSSIEEGKRYLIGNILSGSFTKGRQNGFFGDVDSFDMSHNPKKAIK